MLTPTEARKQPGPKQAMEKVMKQRGISGPEQVGSVEDLEIPDGAGGKQRLRVYKPADAAPGPLPIVFWIHGGGWVLFDIDSHYDASCRGLCNKTGAIVVTPDYRRAPEAKFPASHDDVLTAYRWVVANAASFGGDPTRIGIGGESVGGNMAPATVLQLGATDTRPVAQVCVYPVTTAQQFGESMEDAADGRPLNRALLSWMAMHEFEGMPEAAKDPRIELLGWSDQQLAAMPPTVVITDERDPLRSQGEEFARKLDGAGVRTTGTRYDGVSHEFFGASLVLDQAERAQRQAAEHFTQAFAGTAA